MAKTKAEKYQELREYYENNLFEFAKYINPHYCYGDIHRKVFDWLSDPNASDYQLILLPRGHLKSHCIAVWCVWQLTREPWSTIVYLSAGEDLAANQVYAIKNMLLSDRYQVLWPDMIEPKDGDRDKWSAYAINVDHPSRKERGVRDHSIIIKTVRSNAIGLHCSHLVLDDVVIPRFAYTATGRREVQQSVAQFASIKSPGAKTKAVGTRYHPADLYSNFIEATYNQYNEVGEVTETNKLWDVFQRVLEDSPEQDMTGNYLWPRTYDPSTGDWYGFDINVAARILGEYDSNGQREQFYAQYYNDPNDPESLRLSRDDIMYYDKSKLTNVADGWYIGSKKLRLSAAMDVAQTGWNEKTGNDADYTAIVVMGMTSDRDVYLLDLVQFKTSDFNEYYQRLLDLHLYWGFKSVTIETNSGGKHVQQALQNMCSDNGTHLKVEGHKRSWQDGTKAERHAAVVEPLYRQHKMYHFRGGLIPELEEQVMMARPRHDDLEDALCAAIENARPAGGGALRFGNHSDLPEARKVVSHPRFGGRRKGN